MTPSKYLLVCIILLVNVKFASGKTNYVMVTCETNCRVGNGGNVEAKEGYDIGLKISYYNCRFHHATSQIQHNSSGGFDTTQLFWKSNTKLQSSKEDVQLYRYIGKL